MRERPFPARRAFPSRGFTLLEMLVSFTLLVLVLTAVLTLFDVNGRLARAQTQVADMQQALRIAQYNMVRDIRMAGRGGLPRGAMQYNVPEGTRLGLAVGVRNDTPPDVQISTADTTSPTVLEGTDVLTIRGVFSTPVYQIAGEDGTFTVDDPTFSAGTLRIENPHPVTGMTQDLEPILEVIDAGEPEAMILVSSTSDQLYAVVELDAGACAGRSCLVDNGTSQVLDLDFKITGGSHTAAYTALSPNGAFSAAFADQQVAFAGLLEEYRFYVREEFAVPSDETSDLTPRLSRARFFPGTEVAYGADAANYANDIADNVLDLQVALGIDTADAAHSGRIFDDGTNADEWLFNAAEDDPTDPKWSGVPEPPLFYVRLSTVVRTDRRQQGHLDDPIDAIEDHVYGEAAAPATDTERQDRMFRRRMLQTVVDLRNLS